MKYVLTVEETKRFTHDITIETEDDIDDVCDEIESNLECAYDIMYGGSNYKAIDFNEDESGDCSFEIIDATEKYDDNDEEE